MQPQLNAPASHELYVVRPSAIVASQNESLLIYAQVFLLLAGTFVLGRAGVGAIRYGFIVGCIGIGYRAWRLGPGRHLEVALVLFALAPFLRRVVDFSAGFDSNGYMLVGPMLALAPPCIDLYDSFIKGRPRGQPNMFPAYSVMAICLFWGLSLTMFGSSLPAIAVAIIKFGLPVLYGLWISERGSEEPYPVDCAARGCLIVMPLIGCYALYQYFYLPDWDADWLLNTATINTAQGLAEAEKVRVFSTLNSAASFGHYAAASLLLLWFIRPDWLPLFLSIPVAIGLMLSLYRTSWMGIVLSLLYLCCYSITRKRASMVAAGLVVGAAVILTTTSFGDTVLDRLSTFGQGSEDGSGEARLSEFSELMKNADDLWIGYGLSGQKVPPDHAAATPITVSDGILVESVLTMGWFVGAFYLLSLVWITTQALGHVGRGRDRRKVVAGAIVVANLLAMPLTSVVKGEVGFLFWSFMGVLATRPAGTSSRQREQFPIPQQ